MQIWKQNPWKGTLKSWREMGLFQESWILPLNEQKLLIYTHRGNLG